MAAYCFMVMPFGKKKATLSTINQEIEIDFDELWQRVFYPTIVQLGYKPIRADEDGNSLIIPQMIQRLYFSDLVIADITGGNANVYYEVGVRHASKSTNCVLLAAEGTRTLFDLAQVRTLRYALPDGPISEAQAQAAQSTLATQIKQLRHLTSPVFDVLPGYPLEVNHSNAAGVRDQFAALAELEANVQVMRMVPKADRLERFERLTIQYRDSLHVPAAAKSLLDVLVDCASDESDWLRILQYIEGLPAEVPRSALFREQRALALAKCGRPLEAIGELHALIKTAGPSTERLGLIAGRHTQLWLQYRDADTDQSALHLDQAIRHYEAAMTLDLNSYYPSSNLPRLYRMRNSASDQSLAERAIHNAYAACSRAINLGMNDGWLNATLLTLHIDCGDFSAATAALQDVIRERHPPWKLATIIRSSELSIDSMSDINLRRQFTALAERLKQAH